MSENLLKGVFKLKLNQKQSMLPAFLCALIAIIVVSLVTAKPEQPILDEFDEVSKLTHS